MNILIVRLGALGDIVHAIPAAAALRRAHPDARIDWVVDARHAELLDLVPVINRRIVVSTSGAGAALAGVRELRKGAYDVALDLQGLLKSAVLARLSGAKRVIGFPSTLLRERTASPFYTETSGEAAPHVIQKNLSVLSALGVRVPDVEFPIEDRRQAVVAEARSRMGIGPNERFVLLNPGAAWPNKQWPPVYFAEAARALRTRHGLRSLVLWGPAERDLAQGIVDASEGAAAVSPETAIADLVSLSKAAALMISGDTGPMHIAAAAGTPIVGIFGPTDPARNGPWNEDDLTVSRYRTCECHYQRRCRINAWCLVDISPREVMDLVDRRLVHA